MQKLFSGALLGALLWILAPSSGAGSEMMGEVSSGKETAHPGGIRVEETEARFGKGELREPLAAAVDQRGRLYVADAMTGKIYRYSEGKDSLEFESTSASLFPLDLGVEGSIIYVLDYTGNRILRFSDSGAFLDILLSFDEFPNMRPVSFTVGEGGRFLTTDIEHHSMTVWTPLLEIEFTTGEYGWTQGAFDDPRKATSLPGGGIAIVDSGNRRLQILSPTGTYERTVLPPEETPFLSPRWVTSDGLGNIFVADSEAGALFVFDPEGRLLDRIESHGGEMITPTSAVIGWNDQLYVTDLRSKTVLVYRLHYR